MSWKKNFSLRRKPTGMLPSEPEVLAQDQNSKSLKRGDEQRIKLMNMVKEGTLSVDNAMQKAYGMGIASVPYEELDQDVDNKAAIGTSPGEIYNFGVYRYGKNNKSVKCILQVDCQDNCLSLLQRGQKQKSYTFNSVKNVDTADDTTSLFIKFDDATEIEIDAGTYEEKNRISRLLRMISDQLYHGSLPAHISIHRDKVLKEGVMEKKGHSAAFLIWAKRYVRICESEIMYFRLGEEKNESLALSIIPLSNDIFIKKLEDNGLLLITNKKEYAFRVVGQHTTELAEKERDDWIMAIHEACKPTFIDQNVGNSSETVREQEQYLKSVVHSLNNELEQLGVMLNIIDAPIRASTQVKKVRQIVYTLNEQIQTGLLSWTMRNASHSNSNLPNLRLSDFYQRNDNSYSAYPIDPSYYNQCFPCNSYSTGPVNPSYYNLRGTDHENSSYSHLEGQNASVQNSCMQQQDGYNMLNLSNITQAIYEESSYLQYSKKSDAVVSLHQQAAGNESSETFTPPEYAKVNKARTIDQNPYYNLQTKFYQDSEKAPPLPPKLSEEQLEEYSPSKSSPSHEEVYTQHEFKQRSSSGKSEESGENLQKPEENINSSSKEPDTEYESVNIDSLGVQQSANVPAPPPLPCGVPPPPPIGGLMFSLLPPKEDKTPNCKMKPLFWTKVADMQINSSVWKDAEDRTDAFDLQKLENLFYLGQQQKMQKPVKNSKEVENSKTQPLSLLNPKKAQNFGIFLSGFKLNADDIEHNLSVLDENAGLSVEQISLLKRFQPTMEELEMFKSFQGDVNNLPKVDRFMLTLCKIPHLSNRLDILLTLRELPEIYEGIESPVASLLSTCIALKDNSTFPRLLEYVLSIGNYVNGGTTRGRAHGFKLSALVKLVDIRSVDKKHTLLQYVAEELYEADQECLFCYKDIPSLLLPTDASVKGLIAEVEIMKKDLLKVSRVINDLTSSLPSGFHENVKNFIEEYTTKIESLESDCNTIVKLSSQLKEKFGESSSSDFQVWLNNIADFMKQLQRATESVEQKRKRLSNKNNKIAASETVKCENNVNNANSRASNDDIKKAFIESDLEHKSPHASDIYEKVVSHTTNYQPVVEVEHTNENPVTSSNIPTKVFTLKQATVFESNNAIIFDDETDDDEFSFPLKSGYLEKLSGGKRRNPKWDKRYFEITSAGYLHYSKKKDGKLSGAIYLRGSPIEIDVKDPCVLIVYHQEREWKMKGENDLEILDWFNVLLYYSQMDEIDI